MADTITDAIKAGEDTIPEGNSMEHEKYAFKAAGDGHPEGMFTNKVLNQDEKNQAAVRAARMRGGLPIASFDAQNQVLQEAHGWLSVSLIGKPEWAKNLGLLHDDEFVFRLWNIVQEHERIFCGSRTNQG